MFCAVDRFVQCMFKAHWLHHLSNTVCDEHLLCPLKVLVLWLCTIHYLRADHTTCCWPRAGWGESKLNTHFLLNVEVGLKRWLSGESAWYKHEHPSSDFRTYVDLRVQWSTYNSCLGRQRWDPQSKLADKASHIGKLWVCKTPCLDE